MIDNFESIGGLNQTIDQTLNQNQTIYVNDDRQIDINTSTNFNSLNCHLPTVQSDAKTLSKIKYNQVKSDYKVVYPFNDQPEIIDQIILDRPQTSEKSCRICLDVLVTTNNQIITPCKCRGSMGFIHEECLKTWIVSKNKQIIGSSCEICKYEYKMTYEIQKVCIPQSGCRNHKGNGQVVACLFVVFSFLFALQVIVIIQIVKIFNVNNANNNSNSHNSANTNSNSDNSSSSSSGSTQIQNSPVTMIGLCIFLFFLLLPLLLFLFIIIRQICLIKRLKYWRIEQVVQTPISVSSYHDENGEQQDGEQQDQSESINNNSIINILNEQVDFDYALRPSSPVSCTSQFQQKQQRDSKSLLSYKSKQSRQSLEEVLSIIKPQLQQQKPKSLLHIKQKPVHVFLDAQYDQEERDIQFLY